MINREVWKRTLALLHHMRRCATVDNNKFMQEELADILPELETEYRRSNSTSAKPLWQAARRQHGSAAWVTEDDARMLVSVATHMRREDGSPRCAADLQNLADRIRAALRML